MDRPQATGQLASADVIAVTKFCVTSGVLRIYRDGSEFLFLRFVLVSAYCWNNQLTI